VPNRSEEYRALAADCRERAKQAYISEVKYSLEQTARNWVLLAEQVENQEPPPR